MPLSTPTPAITPAPAHMHLIRALQAIDKVGPEEMELIANLPLRIEHVRENRDIVKEGDLTKHTCLLLEGFLCRYKMMSSGQRQILSFHIPGDIPDLQSLHLEQMDHSLSALTPSTVAMISHDALRAATEGSPRFTHLLWRTTLIDAARFRQWIAMVGHRTAPQRVAHLFCELFVRMRAIGLVEGDEYFVPITQGEFAEALGLSTVHINRTLRELRAAGLVEVKGQNYRVLNWKGLREAGDFDPAYLHLHDKDVGR